MQTKCRDFGVADSDVGDIMCVDGEGGGVGVAYALVFGVGGCKLFKKYSAPWS
jgi:hypothetical protein